MDKLGFCEAWFGEHHSTGWETIGSPELMIAAAAELTRRIRLGTGVIWLPFHNPLMVANRIVQLDHMTMGRALFGVGPGLLPTDAMMLGIDIASQRDRMVEALEVILPLLRGEEVTHQGSWFTLNKARVLSRTGRRFRRRAHQRMKSKRRTRHGREPWSLLIVRATAAPAANALAPVDIATVCIPQDHRARQHSPHGPSRVADGSAASRTRGTSADGS